MQKEWTKHLDWLNSLPLNEFYANKWAYERMGYDKYKKLWLYQRKTETIKAERIDKDD